MLMPYFVRVVAAATIAACALAVTASAASAYRVIPNEAAGIAAALLKPAAPPPGANVGCRPSAAHPYPVVLANGTFSNSMDDYGALAPALANAGYCVYTVNYGYHRPSDFVQSIGPVAQSAQTFAAYVNKVLAQTGASKVDLVGHSQGGLITEYYAKVLGGARKIHTLVALSPTTHGTTLLGLGRLAVALGLQRTVAGTCPACRDQLTDSTVVKALNNGPVAQRGVNYTVIETRNETVVTPAGSAFIKERGVRNLWVQSYCALDLVDHANLSYDNTVIRLVRNALDPATARSPSCWIGFPAPAR
jgi:triacylglycerol esterase/lipase EstA (alpha/beta hydrolase family)